MNISRDSGGVGTSKESSVRLAPSKSTVYISNLPFSLTNSDLFKIFQKFGLITRVTICRDKSSHRSKGTAFVLFLKQESALNCVKATHCSEMFGRTLKANIAKDNGRAAEFIKRREYPNKTRCYECGEFGHLSYDCPKNILGERERPPRKKKRKKTPLREDENEIEEEEDIEEESLSSAIRYQQELIAGEEFLRVQAGGEIPKPRPGDTEEPKRKIRPSKYFSDDEEEED